MTASTTRPHVPGLRKGDVVFSRHGRRMRVQSTDEFVLVQGTATGPYCLLQALDDKNCTAIWPRHWYTQPGETLTLDFAETA